MAEPSWEVSIYRRFAGAPGGDWLASLAADFPSREEARAAAEGALRTIECHAALLEACRKALHLVEENNEEVVQMVGSFGLWKDLTDAIAMATTPPPP